MSNVFPSLRRCYATPISDLLRLQFTGSLDWRTQLHDSELPTHVQELIEKIVSDSRLMRFEQSTVARELIAHFQDGVQAGRSYEELCQEFGDAEISAELIRRSKLRNRPMLMKLLRGLGFGVGMLVAAYLLVTVYFHMGKPTPSIDYVTEINRHIVDVDQQDKAWLIYRPLWTKYGYSEGGGFRTDDLFIRNPNDQDDLALMRPTDPDWQKAVDFLTAHEDLLDGFRRGAKLPFLGVELKSDPRNYSDEDFAALMPGRDKATYEHSFGAEGLDEELEQLLRDSNIAILLPHVQMFRRAARMFIVDTRLAVEQGDSARTVDNLKTFFGLARQAAEGDMLVCSLVGVAVAGIGFNQIEEVIEENPDFLSENQLADLQAHLEQVSIRDWMRIEGERTMVHDMIQRVFTDDGHGDGRMTPAGVKLLTEASTWIFQAHAKSEYDKMYLAARNVAAPASLFLCASRKETAEKCDELFDLVVADFAKPFWESSETDYDDFLENNYLKFPVLSVLFPAAQQVRNAMDRTIGRQEGVIAALAIHRYYLRNGEWPQEFADVSPEFVSEFPIDQVNGLLLNFTYNDDELLIYSVGNDLDDDGGQDRVDEDGQFQSRDNFVFSLKDETDGDWILWPQRYDDREDF